MARNLVGIRDSKTVPNRGRKDCSKHREGAAAPWTFKTRQTKLWAGESVLVSQGGRGGAQGGWEIRVRDDSNSAWRSWIKVGADEILTPLDFTADGRSMILLSSIGSDTARVVEKNIATGAERDTASSDVVDAGDPNPAVTGTVMIHPTAHAVQAVSCAPGRASWTVVDPSVKADFQGIQKLREGDFSVVSRDDNDSTWLVSFTSDRGPFAYFAWEKKSRTGRLLFVSQPKLEGFKLAAMEHVVVKSRDGLDLHSYLTLPEEIPAKRLPLVLFVHGGPWARDVWGYNPTAQWFANRGYACLQVPTTASRQATESVPQCRIPPIREEDARRPDRRSELAVAKGYADPKRVGIYGGSYGGYAALAGLAFTPDFFMFSIRTKGMGLVDPKTGSTSRATLQNPKSGSSPHN